MGKSETDKKKNGTKTNHKRMLPKTKNRTENKDLKPKPEADSRTDEEEQRAVRSHGAV
jgi:hypothetical protein